MAVKALKYKLLSKGMLNLPDEVINLVSGQLAIRCSPCQRIHCASRSRSSWPRRR